VRGYLDPGEQVRFQARPHTAALFRPLARFGIGIDKDRRRAQRVVSKVFMETPEAIRPQQNIFRIQGTLLRHIRALGKYVPIR